MEPTVNQTVCSGACTITHVVTVQQLELTSERVQDYLALWASFLLAAVVVLGAKALYKRFRVDYEH